MCLLIFNKKNSKSFINCSVQKLQKSQTYDRFQEIKYGNSRKQILFYNCLEKHILLPSSFSSPVRGLPTPGWSSIFYFELFWTLGGYVNALKEKLVQITKRISCLMAGFLKSHFYPQGEWLSGRIGKRNPLGWWFGAQIQVHVKRRSLHTRTGTVPRTPLEQPWRWGIGISGQSLMNFAYLEVSTNGNSTIWFSEGGHDSR